MERKFVVFVDLNLSTCLCYVSSVNTYLALQLTCREVISSWLMGLHLRCCSIYGTAFQEWSEVAQSCPTLCYPMDCSLPGSSVHGIFQARILEWVATSFSRGSSRPRDRTRVAHTVGRCFTIWATREAFQEWCWLKEREREVRVKSVGKLCGAQSSWRARERWSSRCWGVRVKTCCPGIWSIQVAHW